MVEYGIEYFISIENNSLREKCSRASGGHALVATRDDVTHAHHGFD